MSDHLSIQQHVHVFNSTFAPFIMAMIMQVFVMCLPLFYLMIKQDVAGFVQMSIFLGNGIQILMR
jgi:hypothetical protein